MAPQPQRKPLRFRKGRSLEITIAGVATPILTAALTDDTSVLDQTENLPSTRTAFTSKFTSLSFDAGAVTELGKMWDVTIRGTQCLADNGLIQVP